jgi:hypothetical protein
MDMGFRSVGPLVLAVMDITAAGERFETERLRQRYTASLLDRTDRMLDRLEEMNLLEVPRVPEGWPVHIATVVADLPFDYEMPASDRPTPTEAIEMVFDLQQALLLWMTGGEPEREELETAS